MPTASTTSIEAALSNIIHFGDTDVLPYPLERTWFSDDVSGVTQILVDLDNTFDASIGDYPVTFVKSLTSVGYNGFRPVTQIEPLWNAYLLALVIEIAEEIEVARVPVERNHVFSYRYRPDAASGGLFDKDVGWRAFQTQALEHAETFPFVLSTDISDFYPRIYHHRLENTLSLATKNKAAVSRINIILNKISENTSYGLPIGGNASRILAEALLNRVDKLLISQSVCFCRFVDDYLIFAKTREEAQRALVTLSDLLLRNEGLTLARAKSRMMSAAEFKRSSPLAEPEKADSEEEYEAKRFLRIRWNYDPYSPTASEDYQELVNEVGKFDIVAMLATEFRKTRVDESLVRQLVRSLKYVSNDVRDRAVSSLVDNFRTLYPVFPTVAIVLRSLLPELSEPVQQHVYRTLRSLIRDNSHIVMVPTNAAYVARLLVNDRDDEVETLLVDLFKAQNSDQMLRRDIIYIMARRDAHYWLSDLLKRRATLSQWELRALLVASYKLGDEGKHWRKARDRELSSIDKAFVAWAGQKNNGAQWEIPL